VVSPPELLKLAGEAEYRSHFLSAYVGQAHFTVDHIRVRFYSEHFDHAFFESSNRKLPTKDTFSRDRAERMPWIAATLSDPNALLVAGWLKAQNTYTHDRRACILANQYNVVIRLGKAPNTATFVTAYPLSPTTSAKILTAPAWDRAKCLWGP
jgi:hypothetical protein